MQISQQLKAALSATAMTIFIVFTPLHPIHCPSLYTVYTLSANSIGKSHHGLSGSTSSAILLVDLVMGFPGQHRQPHHWYIFLWLVRVDIFSRIIGTSCPCMTYEVMWKKRSERREMRERGRPLKRSKSVAGGSSFPQSKENRWRRPRWRPRCRKIRRITCD